MKRIARDETSHADLAWSVHAWLMTKLDADERARVIAAMEHAVAELAAGALADVPQDMQADLGLPPARIARKLVANLDAALWAPSVTEQRNVA